QLKPQQANFPPRPLIPESQRAEVLSALKAVDGVVIFPQLTATHLIATLKPDIYVKGGDYTPETLPEYPDAIAHGVRIELVKVEVGASTSAIIKGILEGSRNE
ncbi:D-glycero-beta-D-manno-heptose 1-phosphate adenylyltransferase, partial [Spirulina sp. 06S082]|nr:D-glycero-beta-D-manno-heptose 1-phosphate adenylyltransferase [Spirulina sp. 06S082]